MAIEVNDLVIFQAYKTHTPIKGKVVRKGTLIELGRTQLDKDDTRIFYELETLREHHNFIFTCTTRHWIKNVK